MGSDLRELLVAAEIAAMEEAERAYGAGRTVTRAKLAEERADRSAAVVAEWLRTEAQKVFAAAEGEVNAENRFWVRNQGHELHRLADSIDPKETPDG